MLWRLAAKDLFPLQFGLIAAKYRELRNPRFVSDNGDEDFLDYCVEIHYNLKEKLPSL